MCCKQESSVYRKPTKTGELLHHQSHVVRKVQEIATQDHVISCVPPFVYMGVPKSTKENFHEFVESSEHILKVIMMKFVGFVNDHDHS